MIIHKILFTFNTFDCISSKKKSKTYQNRTLCLKRTFTDTPKFPEISQTPSTEFPLPRRVGAASIEETRGDVHKAHSKVSTNQQTSHVKRYTGIAASSESSEVLNERTNAKQNESNAISSAKKPKKKQKKSGPGALPERGGEDTEQMQRRQHQIEQVEAFIESHTKKLSKDYPDVQPQSPKRTFDTLPSTIGQTNNNDNSITKPSDTKDISLRVWDTNVHAFVPSSQLTPVQPIFPANISKVKRRKLRAKMQRTIQSLQIASASPHWLSTPDIDPFV
ncbi:hypothetical protein RFI_27198 [Reticulomyxa filosa]|uniref:Uncharacterized protein n=1 Tax=Reticulomyxa filosa TaxID=46433 RepID=X6M868_RETFI|nr:hypothetical protein RFI_27198 [Reticulomyxa filosa]|eukprot:ETO10178.1 hypothetical protein RFI_27198 [Reticulomyxa filosa]